MACSNGTLKVVFTFNLKLELILMNAKMISWLELMGDTYRDLDPETGKS